MIGAMLCGLGFICALVVSFLDKMGVRALGDEDNLKMQSKKLVGQRGLSIECDRRQFIAV